MNTAKLKLAFEIKKLENALTGIARLKADAEASGLDGVAAQWAKAQAETQAELDALKALQLPKFGGLKITAKRD